MIAHGEFGRLFRDHKQPVEGALPFTKQWARKLMRVASNPSVANGKHAFLLPADIESVYELTKLPEEALTAAIEDGRVRPDMTREEAKA